MKTFVVTAKDLKKIYGELKVSDILTELQFEHLMNRSLNGKELPDNTYTVVPWPESQEYMEKSWFDDEAILDLEMKHGDSAYFIPTKYLL